MPKINWEKVEMDLIYCGCSKLEIRVLKWIVKRFKKRRKAEDANKQEQDEGKKTNGGEDVNTKTR